MKIVVYLWSESTYKGNCSQYFVKGIYGRNICFTGIDGAKVYTDIDKANKAIEIVKNRYPHAVVGIY